MITILATAGLWQSATTGQSSVSIYTLLFTLCDSCHKPEQVSAAVTLHLYSVGARFTFRLEHHIYRVFVVLLSCSREMTGEYLDDNITGRSLDEDMTTLLPISQFLIHHQFSYRNVG
jgi:hypothetical protein